MTDYNDVLQNGGNDAVRESLDGARVIEFPKKEKSSSPDWLPKRGYRVRDDDHIEFQPKSEDEDGEQPWSWLCSPIRILATTADDTGGNQGLLLEFYNAFEDRWETLALPIELTIGEVAAYLSPLMKRGFRFNSSLGAKRAIGQLFQLAKPSRKARNVNRTGWFRGAFVLPHIVIGEGGKEGVIFQSSRRVHNKFRQAGTLDGWQASIATPSEGNSRLVLAISLAFAAPCLRMVNMEGGGIHLYGESSIGKSTALRVAGSVWGGGGLSGYIENWNGTSNSVEGRALAHSETLLCLEELGQASSDAVFAAAYSLANGQGKSRMSADAGLNETPEWRVLFLSDGEITLGDKIGEDRGRRSMAGQAVRVIDIAADAGKGFGIFDRLPENTNAGKLAELLKQGAEQHYGVAAIAFLERITRDYEDAQRAIAETVRKFVARLPDGCDGQVHRVAKRFGLIAAAGELAISYGVLPWKPGESMSAANVCFRDWLSGRGTKGPLEIERGIEQVRKVIERDGSSRFVPWDRPSTPVANRLGFVKTDLKGDCQTFFIFPGAWKEILAGFPIDAVTRQLVKQGVIEPDGNKWQRKERLPGMNPTRVYVVNAAQLFE